MATDFGFTPGELQGVTDPRIWKLVHRAHMGDQALKRAAAEAKLAANGDAKPVPQVGNRAQANRWSPTDPAGDKSPVDEWMKRRTEQTRKR